MATMPEDEEQRQGKHHHHHGAATQSEEALASPLQEEQPIAPAQQKDASQENSVLAAGEQVSPTRTNSPKRKHAKHYRFLTLEQKYQICQRYQGYDMKQKEFLESEYSGDLVTGTKSECVSFGQWLKQYKAGNLISSAVRKRQRLGGYPLVEHKLVAYVRQNHHHRQTLSWKFLSEQCKAWATHVDDPKYKNFTASPGFMANCLKRHGIVGLKLLSPEETGAGKEDNHGGDALEAGPLGATTSDAATVPSFSEAQAMLEQLHVYAEANGFSEDDQLLLLRFEQRMRSKRAIRPPSQDVVANYFQTKRLKVSEKTSVDM